MADLTGKEASQSVKIAGADPSTGAETNYIDVDSSGNVKAVINNGSGASAVNIQDGGNSITVDGTITANQGGTWDIRNITGTVSLPTGASTLAEQQTQTTSLQLIDNLPHANNVALSNGVPVMGQLDDTSTGAVTENNVSTVRITPSRALHTQLRDQSGNEKGIQSNPLEVRDKFESSIVSGNLSVGTSAVEAKVGGGRLSNRRMLYIENTGTTDLFYGPSGVTSSGSAVGAILRRRQFVFIPVGDLAIYVISSASGGTSTIQEMA